jgi:hypothetical protein
MTCHPRSYRRQLQFIRNPLSRRPDFSIAQRVDVAIWLTIRECVNSDSPGVVSWKSLDDLGLAKLLRPPSSASLEPHGSNVAFKKPASRAIGQAGLANHVKDIPHGTATQFSSFVNGQLTHLQIPSPLRPSETEMFHA